ncbi:TolB family protein [Lacimicrobium alkaliphilum]|uniref:DUF5050 domain-containing protein n=1 Tax=Lacimicrobium alkaliphilum TaxID=1526571 RepID=A0ABQ1RDI3_9ALTE|nr:DUF5050 domain-containing protein [Lacimicrobium alkaliphilum]GGD63080.1 hypothetical protein GCM10011357_17950 [Lacimicrobium alkaliphilum]
MKLVICVLKVGLLATGLHLLGCSSDIARGSDNNPSVNQTKNTENSQQRLLFVSNQDGDREIYTVRLDGSELHQLTHTSRDDYDASWSPDGGAVLFTSSRNEGNAEIYVMQPDGSDQKRLTNHPGYDGEANWSPDGKQIIFSSDRNGSTIHLYTMHPDGSEIRQITTDNTASYGSPEWAPDGQWIAYLKFNTQAKADTWIVNVNTGQHQQITNHPKHEDGKASWAPESTRLVYHSRRNKEFNIYQYDLKLNKERKLTDLPSSDSQPQWSNTTGEILFLSTRGPHGRTQLHIMKEDGSQQRSFTDAQYQIDDAIWLADDSAILMVSWQGGRYSNVYALNLSGNTLWAIAPAKGYQSQPLPEPAALPTTVPQLAGSASQALH